MAVLRSKLIRILLKLEARERIVLNERPLKYGSWPNVSEVLSHSSGQLCEMGWRGRLMQSALQAFRGRHNPSLPPPPAPHPSLSPWLSVSWALHAWVHEITDTLDRAEAQTARQHALLRIAHTRAQKRIHADKHRCNHMAFLYSRLPGTHNMWARKGFCSRWLLAHLLRVQGCPKTLKSLCTHTTLLFNLTNGLNASVS